VGHVTDAPTWTILVPTLGQRAALFERLLGQLLPQVEPYAGRVRVVGWFNNGDPPLADIRQMLLLDTTTDYVSFMDDDDEVAEDIVARVMTALESGPDYVGWQTHYSANGKDHGLVDHSLRHGKWTEQKNPYRLLRDITHINPMRTRVAQRGDFRRGSRTGRPEDRPWVEQIRATRALKTEVYIDAPMYFYRWRRDTSAWQRPDRIDRTPTRRPYVASPYFSWHPRSAGIATTPEGDTVPELLIIIPTRGRPQNAERVIKAWEATGAFEVASVLFAIDEDDPAKDEYLETILPTGPNAPYRADKVAVTVREREPMARRTNIEAAFFVDQFYALGSAGDDHVPETAGWAQRYLAELKGLGAGVVYGDDGFQHEKLSTEWAMTSNMVKALDGRLVPAPVDHLYADNSVHELARVAGVLKYLPDVKITHHHPAAGLAQRDEGYQRVNARERFTEDGARYKTWRRTQLPRDVSAVRALNPLVTAPPVPAPGSTKLRHRTRLGTGPGGTMHSKPSTRLDPDRQRRNRAMRIPTRIRKVRGLTSEEALIALADMARQVPADQAIVELGVYQGQSALVLAWGASQGQRAHIHAYDPWDMMSEPNEDISYMGKGFQPYNSEGNRRWAQWNVRSLGYSGAITLEQAFSADAGHAWTGPPVGLLFVDGDHSYEGVLQDVTAWASHLAPEATIVFDDYVSGFAASVIRAIDDLVTAGVLEPVQVHSGRLAVTRLAEDWNTKLHAMMGGWVRTRQELEQASQEGIEAAAKRVADPDPEGDRRPGDGEGDPAWDGVEQAEDAEDMSDHGALDLLQQDEQARFDDGAEARAELAQHATESARLVVAEGPEADATTVPAGTSIEELNTVQLRALAKTRGIKLGTRKDKKDEMLDALRAGE
jgi:hypothetical protein